MTDLLLGAAVLAIGAGVALVVFLARERRIPPRAVRFLALVCAGTLMGMLLSDWPSELLSHFWADHSILAGILSTLLLVGVVFLAFEDAEQRAQDVLDSSLTATGLGGVVDHVVDVEVALALLTSTAPPSGAWSGWHEQGKPLRWLRRDRRRLHRCSGTVAQRDPRAREPGLPGLDDSDQAWRVELVDQCVRRLLAAIRDWAPVIGGSRNGVQVLLALSELRKDLMELSHAIERSADLPACEALLRSLRGRLRVLAHFFEKQSGADPLRPEVLLTISPLHIPSNGIEWAADASGKKLFSQSWRRQLEESQMTLSDGGRRGD